MKIEIELERLKELLHVATGNIKDFVMDNDGFIYYHLGIFPLLITEDGVSYFNNEDVVWDTHDFELNNGAAQYNPNFLTQTEVRYAKNLKRKFFSTEKAAKNYRKCHLKCMSYNDVWSMSNNKSTDNSYVIIKKSDLENFTKKVCT